MWILLVLLIAVILLIYKILPNIYAFRGRLAYEKSGLESAVELFQKAYKTNRASASIKLTYALLCLRNAQPDKAESIFNEIIFAHDTPEKKKNAAKQYRCMAYIKQGKIQDALEESAELLNKYKNSDLYAVAGYAMLLSGKPVSDIMALCAEAYDYNEDNRDIADNYAVALIMSGDYEGAAEICDKVIQKNRFFPEGHYHKALALVEMKKFEEASDELDLLDDCDFKYLTTFGDDEIEKLRKRIAENA